MVGFPPIEAREDTLRALGRADLFGTGVNPQQMERMRQLEVRLGRYAKNGCTSRIVLVSIFRIFSSMNILRGCSTLSRVVVIGTCFRLMACFFSASRVLESSHPTYVVCLFLCVYFAVFHDM